MLLEMARTNGKKGKRVDNLLFVAHFPDSSALFCLFSLHGDRTETYSALLEVVTRSST